MSFENQNQILKNKARILIRSYLMQHITPLENGNSSSLKCLGRKLYSLKRVYTGVFKNGKMKIFHTCPKE